MTHWPCDYVITKLDMWISNEKLFLLCKVVSSFIYRLVFVVLSETGIQPIFSSNCNTIYTNDLFKQIIALIHLMAHRVNTSVVGNLGNRHYVMFPSEAGKILTHKGTICFCGLKSKNLRLFSTLTRRRK